MKTIDIQLRGTEPGVLMDRFSNEAAAAISKNYKKKQNSVPMEDQLEQRAYRTGDKTLYFPAEWLYQTMLKAAGEYTIPGRGKKSFRDYVKCSVIVSPEQIETGLKEYSCDARAAVNGTTGGRVMVYRPHLPKWVINFQITIIDTDLIDLDTLHTILVRAGQTVGIGNFRPRFGRFIVERFEELVPKENKKEKKELAMA